MAMGCSAKRARSSSPGLNAESARSGGVQVRPPDGVRYHLSSRFWQGIWEVRQNRLSGAKVRDRRPVQWLMWLRFYFLGRPSDHPYR